MKAKYGSDGDDSENSAEAESEDEDGEELTPAVDAAILRTLARIRRKDPEIYESEKGIFEGSLSSLSLSTATTHNALQRNKIELQRRKIHGLPVHGRERTRFVFACSCL